MANLNFSDNRTIGPALLGEAGIRPYNDEFAKNGSPNPATFRDTLRRTEITTDVAAALTTQIMLGAGIALAAGDVVTKVGFAVGATAAITPTNAWVALYDVNGNLLAQSADSTNTAIPASTKYEQSLSAVQNITVSGLYIVALMVKAGTVPSLLSNVSPLAAAVNGPCNAGTVQKQIAATSGSALTATAPATWAAPTVSLNIPYAWVR